MARKADPRPPVALADPAEISFAAAAVLERLEMLTREAGGVKEGGDIEYVHRMRVASRRLRTALRVFGDCLPHRPWKVWVKSVRRITKALGEARDMDVQLEFVARFNTPRLRIRYRPGMRRLRLRLEQRRADLQERVVREVEEFEASRVIESMQDRLQPSSAPAPSSNALLRRARSEVTIHLDELLEFRPFVDQPRCIAELHRMRIATKHLRYSLEFFKPLFGDSLNSTLETAKRIQQMLGDLHDCDVWAEFLPEFEESERTRAFEFSGSDRAFRPLVPGLEYLRRRAAALRRQHYRDFAHAWHMSETDGVWQGLCEALARPAEQGN